MKKFPTIKISDEPDDDEPPSPPQSPKAERKKEENIFVAVKETPPKKQKSAKQLAHLETIRAKALKARQDKAKAKKAEKAVEPAEAPVEAPKPSADARRGDSAVKTYTHAEVEDIIRKTATGIYEKEKEKRIAEVRNKQAELEKKSFDINGLLRKGGRTRW